MVDEHPVNRSDEIRYSSRAVEDPEWIQEFLHLRPSGVVGLVSGDSPHLVTQLFVYDDEEGAIYFHGTNNGETRRIVEEVDEACFTVYEMGRLLPADKPMNFSVEYASVVISGRVRILSDHDRKRHALQLFMSKFAPQLQPGRDYEPMAEDSISRTAVYRIDVEEWSAKQNDQPDHERAYEYDPDVTEGA